jgi:hypothetical protein
VKKFKYRRPVFVLVSPDGKRAVRGECVPLPGESAPHKWTIIALDNRKCVVSISRSPAPGEPCAPVRTVSKAALFEIGYRWRPITLS